MSSDSRAPSPYRPHFNAVPYPPEEGNVGIARLETSRRLLNRLWWLSFVVWCLPNNCFLQIFQTSVTTLLGFATLIFADLSYLYVKNALYQDSLGHPVPFLRGRLEELETTPLLPDRAGPLETTSFLPDQADTHMEAISIQAFSILGVHRLSLSKLITISFTLSALLFLMGCTALTIATLQILGKLEHSGPTLAFGYPSSTFMEAAANLTQACLMALIANCWKEAAGEARNETERSPV
ncbi:hypothetical protein D9611_010797 [Ephemerocybe angulata]|uniref:Uncharacterized protein n=1 Tax=Ephemerocybe angulata TaxID=980116 RepID=A0A8H5BC03_9AGAR|nr:hypothetical protein D9611_010797 [Tulosesus angulatus]